MPARPLTDCPGPIYHVTARGNTRHPVFRDDTDNWVFMQMLGAVCHANDLVAVAWCLMERHFHLVLASREVQLAAAMNQLTLGYARRYNTRYRHGGDVFHGHHRAMLVKRDAYLLEVVRYVLLNPVHAGLCRCAVDWRWSSTREALCLRPSPAWADFSVLYELLGPTDGRKPDALARLLERGGRVPGTARSPFRDETVPRSS